MTTLDLLLCLALAGGVVIGAEAARVPARAATSALMRLCYAAIAIGVAAYAAAGWHGLVVDAAALLGAAYAGAAIGGALSAGWRSLRDQIGSKPAA